MTDTTLPLGRKSAYLNEYAPELLFPIARRESRSAFACEEMPFSGADIWNAWELTWLGEGNKPAVATAEIRVPAETPNLIESKSLKLYLNSFAMSRFDHPDHVAAAMTRDLGVCAGAAVEVSISTPTIQATPAISELPGRCIDSQAIRCDIWEVSAALLQADPEERVEEDLHSHLLRSLCPVTAQPDIGSLWIRYAGPKIDAAALLQYIVSFREHNDFHEACVERMFVDIQQQCGAEKLSLYARYQRRGGIDINPFRSNFETLPGNLRLWRQ